MGISNRFTIDLAPGQREFLYDYAEVQGVSAAECLRRILAEKIIQLQQQEERTP